MIKESTTARPAGPGEPALDGVYLFCFARPGAADAGRAIELPGYGPLEQWVDEPVAAVLCPVELAPFADESLTQDVQWLQPRVTLHDEVIRATMERSPVLPVSFGAVFATRENLARWVQPRRAQIAVFLESAAGRQEWSVKVHLNEKLAGERLAAEQAQAAPTSASAGAQYLQRRRASFDTRHLVQRRATELAEQLGRRLDELAVDSAGFRLHAAPSPWRMIFNRAFLLNAEQVEPFAARLRQFDAEHADEGVRVEFNGPWPLYSFRPQFARTGGTP